MYMGANMNGRLSDANPTPLSISERILYWSTNLTSLALTWFPDSHNGSKFTTESVKRYIDVHRPTLKSLEIGFFCGGWPSIPGVSDFPQLETLTISAFNVVRHVSPAQALDILAAPKLRCITFPYHTDSRQRREGTRFTGEHLSWFRAFAKEKSLRPQGVLDKIVIKYDIHISPEEICFLKGNDNWRIQTEIAWPWEYVVRVIIALFIITHLYNHVLSITYPRDF
jgi:hypothetical protein